MGILETTGDEGETPPPFDFEWISRRGDMLELNEDEDREADRGRK